MALSHAIRLENLYKSYGRVPALRGVTLDVRQGELFGFLGPNGAGKTTTIRCLLDLIRPDSGKMTVLDLDPRSDSVAIRARTGYLPGELALEPNLSSEAALRYLNSLRRGKADWRYVRQLAERLGLDLRMAIKNLSKGNKQKLGVIQALMHRPELLLLDEPTSGLDPLMQQEVYELLREALRAGATVFFSSHILREVETLADRVAIIREGVIVEEADPARLTGLSLRRLRVRFKEPVDPAALSTVAGVTVLSRSEPTQLTLQVEGDLHGLLTVLAALPVADLETEHPSLEEVFLAYYRDERKEAA